MSKTLAIGLASTVLFSCAVTDNSATTRMNSSKIQATPQLSHIQGHMRFLADDLLEGRDTGSVGHEIASLYIAAEFEKYGLKPAGDVVGDSQSYFQRVTFRKSTLVQESPKMTLSDGAELQYPKDYIVGPSALSKETSLNAELVFVGYGIQSEEYNHDDYAGLDVNGKIVVMLSGKPDTLPTEEGAHIGSSTQKRNYAADNGAIGMITLQTPKNEKIRPYQRSLSYLHVPRLRWIGKDGIPGNTNPAIKGGAYFSIPAGEKLFEGTQIPLQDIFAQLDANEIPKGFELGKTITLEYSSNHEDLTSPNVAGVLPGSDPTLKDEYVVFTAHSDHIGVSKSVEKDRINNGAMDNASGTSIMMETARMFSQLPEAPRRSILFLAVTAEEKGLLGADYFAQNPTVSGDMVANVNLDMPLLTYEFADVIAFGASHSTMGLSVEQAVANADIRLSPDPWPEQNLFTRSDHYAFVKQGVPAVFLVTGIESKTPDIDGSKVLNTFLRTHYHSPTDDMNQAFIWKAAETFTQVNFEIGLTLANQSERPKWYRDSFFGKTFGKDLTDRQSAE